MPIQSKVWALSLKRSPLEVVVQLVSLEYCTIAGQVGTSRYLIVVRLSLAKLGEGVLGVDKVARRVLKGVKLVRRGVTRERV